MYLRHLSTEYRLILSADMSAESRPIYRPTLGRYVGRDSVDISADINRHTCRPTPGRYFTATWPILYRHSTNTTLICSALATEFYLLCSTKGAFGAVVLFWPSTQETFMSFFQLCFFSSSSLLYTTLVTFGSSSFLGLLLTEVRYFRGAKNDIQS